MIDNAAQFHYIGLVHCDHGVMMVFREGVLTLDTSLPGWGVMPAAALARLMPRTRNGSPSPSPRSGSSTDSGSEVSGATLEEAMFFEQLSDSCSTGGSSGDSGSRSPSPSHSPDRSPSPRPSSGNDSPRGRAPWSPPRPWLGWFASDGPVQAGPVTQAALDAYLSAPDGDHQVALMAAFLAGQHAPRPPASPAAGMLARLVAFGEPTLLGWAGHWAAAGDAGHVRIGLDNALACNIVAQTSVAEHCNLNPVLDAGRATYLGMVEADGARVLVFDTGLLLHKHPDPRLQGWHPLGGRNHWDLVLPVNAQRLHLACEQDDADSWPVVREFLAGHLHWPESGQFVATLWSEMLGRWFTLEMDLPHGLVTSGDPAGPSERDAGEALQHAPWAQIHDHQRINGLFSLCSGRWHVPVLLGALRCLMAVDAAPELVRDTWHATLQPAIERLLLAHRAQEKEWLATGAIRQPIDGLVQWTQRDRRMRRPEVRVMWPAGLLDELFKTLAPHARVTVTPHPGADALTKAVAGGGAHMLVFQHVGTATQSVSIALGTQCWTDTTWAALGTLSARVQHSFAPDATEHLVAIASVH